MEGRGGGREREKEQKDGLPQFQQVISKRGSGPSAGMMLWSGTGMGLCFWSGMWTRRTGSSFWRIASTKSFIKASGRGRTGHKLTSSGRQHL